MPIISTRAFRANQTHYLNIARSGEPLILCSRCGNFRVTPVPKTEKEMDDEEIMRLNRLSRQDLDDIREGLRQAKEGQGVPITDINDVWASIM